MKRSLAVGLSVVLGLGALAGPAFAHGLAGKRFFPSTLAIDDPFVSDELTLPNILHIKRRASGDESAAQETEFSGEYSKRITPNFGFSLEGALVHVDPQKGESVSRFDNLEVGLKYQAFTSAEHEVIFSLGLSWEVGGTGGKAIGAESFDVVTPALFFGKGFGDLPDSLSALKPLAVTGLVGLAIPTRAKNPNVVTWGFAIEYSLPYLTSYVRDPGLPEFFRRLIPLVEFEFQTPIDRGQGGLTTGTMNPGVIWAGRFFQVGVEAVVPINERTGKNVGIRGMLHFFLDDLFPTSIGRPLFGR